MDDSSIDKEYEFENVLRDMVTPFDGEFVGSDLKAGDKIVKDFTFTLPQDDNLWVAENVNLVAFVTGGEDNAALPVLNAVKKRVVE